MLCVNNSIFPAASATFGVNFSVKKFNTISYDDAPPTAPGIIFVLAASFSRFFLWPLTISSMPITDLAITLMSSLSLLFSAISCSCKAICSSLDMAAISLRLLNSPLARVTPAAPVSSLIVPIFGTSFLKPSVRLPIPCIWSNISVRRACEKAWSMRFLGSTPIASAARFNLCLS